MNRSDIELRERDEVARRDARRVFDRPVVIEAGAGTGKTTILITRIVTWCLGPGWDEAQGEKSLGRDAALEEIAGRVADRVVAITFTEAAAAEMARRVGEALVEIERGKSSPGVVIEVPADVEERRWRARAMLAQVHRLRVSTIHSFCSWILLRFPVEAGVDPEFTVDADGLMVENVIQEVIEDELRAATESCIWPYLIELARVGVTPDRLTPALVYLVRKGVDVHDLPEDPFSDEAMHALESRLRAACEELAGAVGRRFDKARRSKKAVEVLERVRSVIDTPVPRTESQPGSRNLERLRGECQSTIEAVGKKLKDWALGKFGKEEGELLAEQEEDVSAAAARVEAVLRDAADLEAEQLQVSVELLRPLLAEIRRRLRARGVMTFDDLLVQTSRLLSAPNGVCFELRRGISQLLVDEFQDTDRSQCEIVWRLAMGDEGKRGPFPGLFIVGDPKQSIYGWRNADLGAYMSFVKRAQSRGAVVHSLSVNFRSTPIILDEVERVVKEVMIEKEGLQPPFQRLLACEERRGDPGFATVGRAPVEYWVNWPMVADTGLLDHQPKADPAAELEADAVAEDILEIHETAGVPWRRFGVLLRTTSKLDRLLASFRRVGVPFEVARDREYYRQREIVEAAALVRFLIDPGDQIALLTVLRSDVVGVPDAALLALWERGLPSMLFDLVNPDPDLLGAVETAVAAAAEEVDPDLPGVDRIPHWPAGLMAAVEVLAVLRESLRSQPAAIFVERLRCLWLAEVSAAARYLGAHRLARLSVFFSDLEDNLAACEGGFDRVARLLRRAVAGEKQVEQTTSPELAEDAVQVMTVHGAKGLDFEHVYLLQMGAGTRPRNRETTQVLHHGDRVELCLFGRPTPGLGAAQRHAAQHEAAELVRLLYVAMTRAKQRLVLSADWPDKIGHGERIVKLLRQRWHQPTVSHLEETSSWRASETDGQVHWVLPAFQTIREKPVDARGALEGTLSRFPDTDHAERLRRARGQARRHMERTFAGGVSAVAHSGTPEGEPLPAGGGSSATGTGRSAAAAVGTAVHRLFENLDLTADLQEQLESGSRVEMSRLEAELAVSEHEPARKRLLAIVDGLAGGECLSRLRGLGNGHVLARELPMLLPPEPDVGPVAVLAGVADLVYRDPENDEIVVADYKTDLLPDEETMADRIELYEPQLGHYARGIEQALGLASTPRQELWFLDADRIVVL